MEPNSNPLETQSFKAEFANNSIIKEHAMHPVTINDIPSNEVPNVISSFINRDNAVRFELIKKSNGKWSITAYIPS